MCLLSAEPSVHVDLFARNVSSSDHHFVISNLVATGRPNCIIIPSHGSIFVCLPEQAGCSSPSVVN